ncbi:hypothetical protein LTR37_013975 [Vermiconidia calcicola]|uniref:Uncharacterized protein n=1 Tax=Vermiconidia calcicola TaxID=1690605 RepID=A0ACC3MUN2_9PEZI|nr:hypothetical protein LTR37_013975 [Vermiconidia calcicola]
MADTKGDAASRFDPTFTQNVINAMGPNTSPRMREIMGPLIQHLHDFAREVELTVDEWMEGVQLINRAGQMSDDKRNEGQLVCDVIGLESLVDEITYKKAAEASDFATQSAILGPFFREDHPIRKKGESIIYNTPDDGEARSTNLSCPYAATDRSPGYLHVRAGTGRRIQEAVEECLYEQQDDNQQDSNLRGKFYTDENGEYAFYCLRPTPYPVPFDGPAGKLLQLMDRHPYRPAHIHLIALGDGYKPITTQIFDKESKYLDNDSVFAVKDSLTVEFVPRKGNDSMARSELQYDILMAPMNSDVASGPEGGLTTNGLMTKL